MDARKNKDVPPKKNIFFLVKYSDGECGSLNVRLLSYQKWQYLQLLSVFKKMRYWRCPCRTVDDAVFSYFKQLLSNSNKERIYKSLQSYTKSLKLERKASGDSIKKQIDEKQRQIDVYIENMGKSSLPEEILKNMGEKIMELKEQIATLETEQTLPLDYSKQQVINYLTVLTMLDAAIFQLQRDTIQTYIEFVEIKKTASKFFPHSMLS